MPELSRTQIVVYGAIAVALLLIGARAIRGEGGGPAGGDGTTWSDSGSGWSDPGSAEAESGAAEAGEGEFELGQGGGDVVVDVTGAVARPGVYRLPVGSRVNDALQRAGGAAPKAQLEAVNLAARLADGQQVVVPERAPAGIGVAATGAGAEEGPISLGTATLEQLDTIDGIGPVTAEDIVQFREEHGGLSSIEQLDQISGIGPATMEALRARLQP
ncbi:MAG: ComEA family DNA-binding protein [Actinobacteria bacterium]|nr:ComEA family DNA-binding protein [Actinomycetota bacterium]